MDRKKKSTNKYLTKRQLRQVKNMLYKNKELHHTSYTTSEYDYIPAAGLFTDMTAVSRGDGDQNRIGDKVLIDKVFTQLIFKALPVPSTETPPAIRVLFVQSKTGPLTIANMPLFEQPCDLDDMYVLDDSLFHLPATAAYNSGGTNYLVCQNKRFRKKIRDVKKRLVQYDGTATGATNNGIYMYICHNMASDTTVEYAGFRQFYFKNI